MVRTVLITLLVPAFVLACSGDGDVAERVPPAAQDKPAALELDHVFVVVTPGAVAEAALLEEAGITLMSDVTQHTGQGTASRSALFDGAYLELTWVDTSVVLSPENERVVERMRASVCTGTEGPSPFGIGLRRAPSTSGDLPFSTTPYRAAWMSEAGGPLELIDTSISPGAVVLFVVPPYMAMSSWEENLRSRAPALFEHGSGVSRVTGIRVHTPVRPARADDLTGVPGLEFVEAERCLLEITFDGGAASATQDLRPGLPIVIHR